MKTIGLIGGMSWESTTTYYRVINETIKEKLGGLHSAKCILYSVDFEEIETCQFNGDWDGSARILCDAAKSLEKAGADFIVICTNTMHKILPEINKTVDIPILHIAEMTAIELREAKIRQIGLLGTKYTMQQDFYKQILIDNGIQVIIPDEKDIQLVNSVIYNELCLGIISETSRQEYLRIITNLENRGAQGVILGCTEIGLLIKQTNTKIPLFDTTLIHAKSAALNAISDQNQNKISKAQLVNYFKNVDSLFPEPLSTKCILNEFVEKLLSKGTLCPEIWDGELVGLVAGYTDNLVNDMAYITTVAVVEKAKHHGIANKLINDFCRICQDKQIKNIHLYTSRDNIQAITLYRKIGFTDYTIENEPRPEDLHLILNIPEQNDF